MKKPIVTLIRLFIISFLFVGCTKDQSSKRNPLIGTKWAAPVSWGALGLTFIDHVNAVYTERPTGESSKTYKATYIYAAPDIRINVEDQNQDFEFNGEVSGASMKLTIGYNGPIYNFQKLN